MPILEVEHICKSFEGTEVRKDISFSLEKSQVLSIIGSSGSGKTTLMNMLSGIYFPDEGQIFINVKEDGIKSPKDALRLGIGMVHQHFKLIDVFTAAENIVLGLKVEGKLDRRAVSEKVIAISQRYGFEIDPDKKVYEMSVSEKQTVEILKVLYRGADI